MNRPSFEAMPPTGESDQSRFETQKRHYFMHLAGSLKSAMRLHHEQGMWERTPEGKRDWGNVTEHCIVEAARVGVMADWLGLAPDVKHDLQTAAALHDFYKKGEVQLMKAKGLSWDSYNEAGEQSNRIITEAGFSERVARLAGSVGHTTVLEAEAIALKPSLTDEDKAYLAMHYADDYTVNAEWAEPASYDAETGLWTNDLTRRMQKNIANPRYKVLDEAGRAHFGGESSYEAQQRVGELVEDRLAGLIGERMGQQINPLQLPEIIDNRIRDDIQNFSWPV